MKILLFVTESNRSLNEIEPRNERIKTVSARKGVARETIEVLFDRSWDVSERAIVSDRGQYKMVSDGEEFARLQRRNYVNDFTLFHEEFKVGEKKLCLIVLSGPKLMEDSAEKDILRFFESRGVYLTYRKTCYVSIWYRTKARAIEFFRRDKKRLGKLREGGPMLVDASIPEKTKLRTMEEILGKETPEVTDIPGFPAKVHFYESDGRVVFKLVYAWKGGEKDHYIIGAKPRRVDRLTDELQLHYSACGNTDVGPMY